LGEKSRDRKKEKTTHNPLANPEIHRSRAVRLCEPTERKMKGEKQRKGQNKKTMRNVVAVA